MRDYGKVGPKFWIGETGKALRKRGADAQLVALYLITSPHANMLGLYYVPTTYIAHETGLGIEGAMKGLASCCEAGFCHYDEASEMVWVTEMAQYQIAERLTGKDLRIKGVQNEYDSLPGNPFLTPFFEKYGVAFCMERCRQYDRPTQAPMKPLASQEQEQEQEQKQEQDMFAGGAVALPTAPTAQKPAKNPKTSTAPTAETWDAYATAYRERYSVDPVRNATVNGQLSNFVTRLGASEAPHVAAFYVWHNNRYYAQQMHSVAAMVKDAEKLRTEWATGNRMTATQADQVDKTQTNGDVFGKLIREAQDAQRRANP